jgi:hypothetical protein
MKNYLLIFVCVCIAACGMDKYTWKDTENKRTASNSCYEASIEPIHLYNASKHGYSSFKLRLQNKTDKDIVINWDKTLYIEAGGTKGLFVDQAMLDSKQIKLPDTVFPKGSYTQEIFPAACIIYSEGSYGWAYFHDYMPEGEKGVILSVTCDWKEVKEKMTVKLINNY